MPRHAAPSLRPRYYSRGGRNYCGRHSSNMPSKWRCCGVNTGISPGLLHSIPEAPSRIPLTRPAHSFESMHACAISATFLHPQCTHIQVIQVTAVERRRTARAVQKLPCVPVRSHAVTCFPSFNSFLRAGLAASPSAGHRPGIYRPDIYRPLVG